MSVERTNQLANASPLALQALMCLNRVRVLFRIYSSAQPVTNRRGTPPLLERHLPHSVGDQIAMMQIPDRMIFKCVLSQANK